MRQRKKTVEDADNPVAATTAGDDSGEHVPSGSNLQDYATSIAFQPPIVTLSLMCLLPVVVMLVQVAQGGRWVATHIAHAVIVSIVGYIVTYKVIPLVAEKLKPKLYGVDIGKRGLGGKFDGQRVPER